MVTEVAVEISKLTPCCVKILWEVGDHRHVLKIETARGASSDGIIINREVTVAIGIGARWSDVSWIENVGVH